MLIKKWRHMYSRYINLNDQEVENLLIEVIDAFLKEDDNRLSFAYETQHAIFWDNNIWFLEFAKADPFAILIFDQNPECCRNSDDDVIVATAAKMLDQSTWWVRSFLDGWNGCLNNSMSITGYLLGDKLRKKYKK